MQKSEELQTSARMQDFDFDPHCPSPFQIVYNNASPEISSQGINFSFQTCEEQYFTLDSLSVASATAPYNSPSSVSVLTDGSPFLSDPHHSSDSNAYGSPLSGSSVANNYYEQQHRLIQEVENFLMEPESDMGESCECCGPHQPNPIARKQIFEIIPRLGLKELLDLCARLISERNTQMALELMNESDKRVSVSGDPVQRLGAYLLEGLRARIGSSGSSIYRRLKCMETVPSKELMSSMGVLFNICPYWKFAYCSANVMIQEAMEFEPRIHIIDFQIAQGAQWVSLMEVISTRARSNGRALPKIRITGLDDSQSAHARGSGLDLLGQKLKMAADSYGFHFEFHNAAMSRCDVDLHDLGIRPGESVAVNFPYILHHMPDESVSTTNHRDKLLRLVKRLSPKVVTIVEQESNTNTSPFLVRFQETMDYYTAMFESIEAGSSGVDSKKRIHAEQQCIARDIVSMVACEGSDRVERHELFRKWQLRLQFTGFEQCSLSPAVTDAVRVLLKGFHKNYRVEERDGALYLGWLNRAMVTSSAWR